MKVTKIVKKYIQEQINNKIPMPEEEINPLIKEWNKILADCIERTHVALTKFAEEHKGEFTFGEWRDDFDTKAHNQILDRIDRINYCWLPVLTTKADKDFCIMRRKIQQKRDKAFKDIIVALELDGTKADLDRMLNEIN